jgi:hypothetical protein
VGPSPPQGQAGGRLSGRSLLGYRATGKPRPPLPRQQLAARRRGVCSRDDYANLQLAGSVKQIRRNKTGRSAGKSEPPLFSKQARGRGCGRGPCCPRRPFPHPKDFWTDARRDQTGSAPETPRGQGQCVRTQPHPPGDPVRVQRRGGDGPQHRLLDQRRGRVPRREPALASYLPDTPRWQGPFPRRRRCQTPLGAQDGYLGAARRTAPGGGEDARRRRPPHARAQ